MATGGGATNRLAQEQSPYLLQHKTNPVDWYPWGEEAFAAARARDVPIFLSVGYSTCHWCHVMERESFESPEIADILNRGFVSIKVDREERPDVDRVYMTYVQALTGGGGWPMSVFLMPDLKPFYGGTYFPPTDRPGMPSFSTLLRRIAHVWSTQRDDLAKQAASTMDQLRSLTTEEGPVGGSGLSTAQLLAAPQAAASELMSRYDADQGGFGGAPKFPRPSEVNALLAAAAQARAVGDAGRSDELLTAALRTLRAYCGGGMYDHLGGGFHRYSVDAFLHVPHFEKMLYDNPQLVSTYLDAMSAAAAAHAAGAGGPAAAGAFPWASLAVRGTLDYLKRDMTSPGGGVNSAEDADSLDAEAGEKREGAFYVWTRDEVESTLRAAGIDPALFCEVYDVRPEGNCNRSPQSDPHGEFEGKNVLIQTKPASEAAAAHAAGLDTAAAEASLAAARAALHATRARRPRPHLDDKIITAWNGDAIGAFARAARVLAFYEATSPPAPLFPSDGRPAADYLPAAVAAARFVKEKLWDADARRLRRSFREAPAAVQGFSADYAYLAQGLLHLAEAGGGAEWLAWAAELQSMMDDLFWDDERGGWFDAAAGSDPSLALRLKEDYDGAEPAPSSVAAANLVRLAALVPGADGAAEEAYLARADAALKAAAGRLQGRAAMVAPQACCAAWLRGRAPLRQVIIAGPAGDPGTAALLSAAHAAFPLDRGVIVIDPSSQDDAAFWAAHNPRALEMVRGHAAKQQQQQGAAAAPTAFVCQDYTCKSPTGDPQRLVTMLREAGGGWRSGGGDGGAASAPAGAGPRLEEISWPPPPAAKKP